MSNPYETPKSFVSDRPSREWSIDVTFSRSWKIYWSITWRAMIGVWLINAFVIWLGSLMFHAVTNGEAEGVAKFVIDWLLPVPFGLIYASFVTQHVVKRVKWSDFQIKLIDPKIPKT